MLTTFLISGSLSPPSPPTTAGASPSVCPAVVPSPSSSYLPRAPVKMWPSPSSPPPRVASVPMSWRTDAFTASTILSAFDCAHHVSKERALAGGRKQDGKAACAKALMEWTVAEGREERMVASVTGVGVGAGDGAETRDRRLMESGGAGKNLGIGPPLPEVFPADV